MILIDFTFAAVIALVLSLAMVAVLGWRHPKHTGAGPGWLFLFILLVAVIWGMGVWWPTFGPTLWGAYWLPYVVAGLITALIVLAVGWPARRSDQHVHHYHPDVEPDERQHEVEALSWAAVFSVFFWLLFLIAMIAVIVRYVQY